jgi:hypothetical protein
MIDNQRFKDVFAYLRENKHVRNQQDFTERIGSDKSTVSQIMNDRISIPNNLFAGVANAFPFISEEWLRTGIGTMLKSTYTQQIFGDGQTTQTGNITTDSPALIIALHEITAMRKMLADALNANQRTNDRLLSLLENLQSK